uniref:Protein F37C4.5 n=1 Tax=Panagrolaimus davidi TaxID=227884 RepID=A0A914QG49_9BILA
MPEQRSIKVLNARDIPITAVTVYTDRAEVIRNFKVNLAPGLNENQLENIAQYVQQDSVKVDVHGNATIHEVKSERKFINSEIEILPKVKELKEELKKLEGEIQKERDLQSVYTARIETLNNLVGQGFSKEKGHRPVLSFDDTFVSSLNKFFEFHEEKSVDTKAKARISEENIASLTAEINRVKNEINQQHYSRESKHVISIEAECDAIGDNKDVEFTVIYQVHNARWTAAYDIRVKSEKDQHHVILSYFGKISQQTGEDWNDVELSLSTAQPALGGDLPELGSTIVEFYRPPLQNVRYQSRILEDLHEQSSFGSRQLSMREERKSAPAMGGPVMVAEEDVLSTTFTIAAKKTTIPSDHAEHKVKITVENLTASLHYHCVPKLNTNVFLIASVINDSDYPLISGSASIYLNNSFSTKIVLKSASCGEKFDIPLGVDKTVKVIYKPKHKFQTQTGMLTKNMSSSTEQKIIIKNTKRIEPILITIHESIPKSSDEKIRVRIISPEIHQNAAVQKHSNGEEETTVHRLPNVGAVLDDLNNLLWTEKIKADHEKEFIVKWSVDYPPNETLRYLEKHQQE